ncbi:MAG: dependent protein [Actinomycetota bacterium]|nr:dependent protein [Actinomycetota bacterium]
MNDGERVREPDGEPDGARDGEPDGERVREPDGERDGERVRELQSGLLQITERIEVACRGVGRSPSEIVLVVVTKHHPARDVRLLARIGVRDVGENRDQEARGKQAECSALDLRWHFVGQLQRNKARSVARYADMVHSVDRTSLVRALGEGARAVDRTLDCLLQVNLDDVPTRAMAHEQGPGRGGISPKEVTTLAESVASEPGLRLRGLMAVAPRACDAYTAFAVLPELRDRLIREHPEAKIISAGMSGDLEAALQQGATHLRVGTAILGRRPTLG